MTADCLPHQVVPEEPSVSASRRSRRSGADASGADEDDFYSEEEQLAAMKLQSVARGHHARRDGRRQPL